MGDEGSFAHSAVRRLDPVLALRGFPARPPGEQDDSVLFHCDGPPVDEVMDRYPGWRDQLTSSYQSQTIPCLDLWVQRTEGPMSWSFEVFERDVAAVAGPQAMGRLQELATGAAEPWLDQLADVLDAYFTSLEQS